jgi:hypothetical protein
MKKASLIGCLAGLGVVLAVAWSCGLLSGRPAAASAMPQTTQAELERWWGGCNRVKCDQDMCDDASGDCANEPSLTCDAEHSGSQCNSNKRFHYAGKRCGSTPAQDECVEATGLCWEDAKCQCSQVGGEWSCARGDLLLGSEHCDSADFCEGGGTTIQ